MKECCYWLFLFLFLPSISNGQENPIPPAPSIREDEEIHVMSDYPSIVPPVWPEVTNLPTLNPLHDDMVVEDEGFVFGGSLDGGRPPPRGQRVTQTSRRLLLPSDFPSSQPSDVPSMVPSDMPSMVPSDMPSMVPSDMPSMVPSDLPSMVPTFFPSDMPSFVPSSYPTRTYAFQATSSKGKMRRLVAINEPKKLPKVMVKKLGKKGGGGILRD